MSQNILVLLLILGTIDSPASYGFQVGRIMAELSKGS